MVSNKKFNFIYKTTNTITGKFYIGMHSTDDLNDGYLGSGLVIKNSIKKYGKDFHSMEVLEFLPDRNTLKQREIEIVNENLLCNELCMNLKVGGVGGNQSGEKHPRYGKRHSLETRLKMSMSSNRTATNVRAVYVDGVEYQSLASASRATGIKITTIGCRIISTNPKFKNTFYKDTPK